MDSARDQDRSGSTGSSTRQLERGPGRSSAIPRRYPALDGLRGLAAVVVFVHHCMIMDRGLSRPIELGPGGRLSGWRAVVTYTPLHVVWAGTEAVFVFFVLSGFVVSLPFTTGAAAHWRAYYGRRIVRLYAPVIVAVAFSLAAAEAVRRHSRPSQSIYLNSHAVTLTVTHVLRNAFLLDGTNGLNGPLWSLRWEVLFSLLLPLYLLIATWLRRQWWLVTAVTVVAVFAGYSIQAGLAPFLPMFMLGVLMAVHRTALTDLAARITAGQWAAITVAGVLLLLGAWTPLPLPRSEPLGIVGAGLIVFVFFGCPAAQRLATLKPVAFLGTISFSLYLTHEPIVVSVALLTHSSDPALIGVISAPICLAVAYVFYRLVEGPSHRLSKRVGRILDDRYAAEPAPSATADSPPVASDPFMVPFLIGIAVSCVAGVAVDLLVSGTRDQRLVYAIIAILGGLALTSMARAVFGLDHRHEDRLSSRHIDDQHADHLGGAASRTDAP